MKLAKAHVIDQEFENLHDLQSAFSKGTIFKDLTEDYKEIKPILGNKTEEETMMELICCYSFVINDLVLYLNTHPNCQKALDMLQKTNLELKKAKAYYNQYFKSLDYHVIKKEYDYIKSPWPWEVI